MSVPVSMCSRFSVSQRLANALPQALALLRPIISRHPPRLLLQYLYLFLVLLPFSTSSATRSRSTCWANDRISPDTSGCDAERVYLTRSQNPRVASLGVGDEGPPLTDPPTIAPVETSGSERRASLSRKLKNGDEDLAGDGECVRLPLPSRNA